MLRQEHLRAAWQARLDERGLKSKAPKRRSQAVTLPALRVYATQSTGKKFLLNPQRVEVAKL